MFMERLLLTRRGVMVTREERTLLEGAISEVCMIEARRTLVEAGHDVEKAPFYSKVFFHDISTTRKSCGSWSRFRFLMSSLISTPTRCVNWMTRSAAYAP